MNKQQKQQKEREDCPYYLDSSNHFFEKKTSKYIGALVFKAIVGSQAYGTSTPESDIDFKGVYVQSPMDILTYGYIPQIEITADEVYYEVRRYLELLYTANPTVLELLYIPQDCIVLKHSIIFDLIEQHKEKFLTKRCKHSFGGYAMQQIKKATGLDKKANQKRQKVTRKTPLDFCYVAENGKTMPLSDFLSYRNLDQKYCGLMRLQHMRDCYALYYDYIAASGGECLGYKGIQMDKSNQVRLTEIPKDEQPNMLAIVSYNEDGYSMHCKEYNEYMEWYENHNESRYIFSDDKTYDSKNMMHCIRLLETAMEIPITKTINVKRPNRERLLEIRKGVDVDFEELINGYKESMDLMDKSFDSSDLPESVDNQLIQQILEEIRLYQLKCDNNIWNYS